MRKDLEKLNALGRSVAAPKDYDPSVLDAFENRHPERDYWVTFTAPEFTTLCPKTGQPDFATLTIRYIPADPFVNGGAGAKYKALAAKRFENWSGVRD